MERSADVARRFSLPGKGSSLSLRSPSRESAPERWADGHQFGPGRAERDSRGRSRRRAPQTAARRKLTTNMPDCGRRAPGRLLSALAVWPQWGGGVIFFFHSTSFPRRTERKRAADVWEAAREGFRAQGRPESPGDEAVPELVHTSLWTNSSLKPGHY